MSAPRPTRLRVYHSSALRGTSQSSAHHLMAALLQVYHSYQSAFHLLPCAIQPCLAPSTLNISFIIFQGRAGPLAAPVAGSQLHDTAGSLIDHLFIYLCRRHRCRIQSTPRPAHPRCYLPVYRLYQSVKLASALQDMDLLLC